MGTSKITYKIANVDRHINVVLSGEITEDADFVGLVGHLPDEFSIDLSGVARINSAGLRVWLEFVGRMNKDGKKFVLERCSPAVVMQLNLIKSFRAGARVLSVEAPYYCRECNHNSNHLVALADGVMPQVPKAIACPRCGKQMEFDEVLEDYFSFHVARA